MFTDLFIQLEEYFVNNTYYSVFYLIAFILLAWMIGYSQGQANATRLLDNITDIINSKAIPDKNKTYIISKFIGGKNGKR